MDGMNGLIRIDHIVLAAIVLLLTPEALCPQFAPAHHEPDINWRTISSEHFLIHYAEEHEELGRRMATICEEIYEPVSQSLDYYPGLTHVVLHTRADLPGGYVSYLPWRIELYATEPQSNTFGTGDDWLRVLIIHEFTHITHFRKRKGLSVLAYPLFGDFGALIQETLPRWFTEGIATLNETVYSQGGRGRTPFHWMQMAAPVWAGKPWRLVNTAYHSRKRTPSTYMPYVSGYYLAFYISRDYGQHVWANILDQYSSLPLLGFGNAVRSVTRKSLRDLYDEMLNDFSDFTGRRESVGPVMKVWKQPKLPEDQLSARWVDQDHLIFYRRSLGKLQELTEVDRGGREEHLVKRMLAKQDNSFTVGREIVVWSELHPHPRFSATLYSDLKIFDRRNNKIRHLTENARIFSPDLSTDQSQIVAVQTVVPATRLITIDLKNGEINTLLEIHGATLLNPRWSPDGERIALSIKDSTHSQNIAILEAHSGRWYYLYPPNPHHDNNPCWTPDGKYVLYASDQSGVFNIWAGEVNTGQKWMITNARLGAFTPDVSPGGNELAFSNYTYTGFTLASMPLDSSLWIRETDVFVSSEPMIFPREEGSQESGQKRIFLEPSTPYRPWRQILRPDGWFPYFLSNEGLQALSLYVSSRDVLYRHAWRGSVGVTPEAFRPFIDWSYTYSRFWPEFHVRTYLLPLSNDRADTGSLWPTRGLELAVSSPLVLERNVYTTFFRPFFQIKVQSLENSHERDYRGIRLGLNWGRTGQALRDIVPHRALFLSWMAEWSVPALGSNFTGRQLFNQTEFFYPTPVPHHQIHLSQRYHNRRGTYSYGFYGALPVGYPDEEKAHQLRLRLSYVLPLAYLELPLPFLPIYLDYLDAAAFYDWGTDWDSGIDLGELTKRRRSSRGVQLTLVSYVLQKVMVRIGLAVFYHSQDRVWKSLPILQYNFGF